MILSSPKSFRANTDLRRIDRRAYMNTPERADTSPGLSDGLSPLGLSDNERSHHPFGGIKRQAGSPYEWVPSRSPINTDILTYPLLVP
jgi:hypothetical protein